MRLHITRFPHKYKSDDSPFSHSLSLFFLYFFPHSHFSSFLSCLFLSFFPTLLRYCSYRIQAGTTTGKKVDCEAPAVQAGTTCLSPTSRFRATEFWVRIRICIAFAPCAGGTGLRSKLVRQAPWKGGSWRWSCPMSMIWATSTVYHVSRKMPGDTWPFFCPSDRVALPSIQPTTQRRVMMVGAYFFWYRTGTRAQ